MVQFSESVQNDAFRRSGGRCECPHTGIIDAPHHGKRFQRSLTKKGRWYAVYRNPDGGGDTLGNCEILREKCHRLANHEDK